MAKAKEVTTKFKVDVSEFKKGIQEANSQIKLANAEFKKASSSMDNWQKSSDGLEAKIKQLNTVLQAEKDKLSQLEKQQQATKEKEQEAIQAKEELRKKIDSLQKEYDDLVKSQGENSESAVQLRNTLVDLEKEYLAVDKVQKANQKSIDDLEIRILNQGATVGKTEKQIRQYESSLTEINASNSKVKSSFEQLEDTIASQQDELLKLKEEYKNIVLEQGEGSREAKNLASQMQSLNKELDDSKKTMANVEKASDDLTGSLKDIDSGTDEAGDGFTVLKGTLADLTANVISNVVSSIGDLVSSLFDLSEATEEYRTMSAKLEGSAKNNGYSIEYATDKYKEFYKYVGDDQMATNAITNLMGLGTTTDSVSKLAEGAIGVWASYGDSIPIESLTEAINETIKVGTVTGTFADTINWTKMSNDELAKSFEGHNKSLEAFNKAIKEGETQEDAFSSALSATSDEQERADIVAQFLNSTYGESKKTYDEMTGSIQDAKSAELELKDTQAELGQAVEPVTTAFAEMKNKALEAILPIVSDLAQKFLDLYDYLKEHPTLLKAVTGVVIGLASAFGVLATALAIQGIITGVTKAIAFLNTTLLTNPIVLIVGLIAGLVASFIYLWNNVEEFRNFFLTAWEQIKTAFSNTVKWVSETFETVKNYISEGLDNIVSFFVNCWEKIKTAFSNVATWFSTIFSNAYNGIVNIFSGIGSFFINCWNAIVTAFSNVASWFSTMFSNAYNGIVNIFSSIGSFFSGCWNSITSVFGNVASWFGDKFNQAWSNIKNAFSGFASFFSGLWNTISSTFSSLGTKIGDAIGSAVKSGINSVISMIEKTINKAISLINGAIDVINYIPGVDIGKIGKLSLPRLAKGGLAKANNPFLAVVGDNPTQDEIISPVGTIRKIVNEELQDIRQSIDVMRGNPNISNVSNSKTVNNTYNQYISSPKALSKLEIYRQTKNLLNKGG